jgi:hypothetical protein
VTSRIAGFSGSPLPVIAVIPGCFLIGAAVATHRLPLVGVAAAAVVAVYVVVALPPRHLTAVAIAVTLVSVTRFPLLMSIGDVEIRLAEAFLMLIGVACFLRGRRIPEYDVYWWALLFIGWGAARFYGPFPTGNIAFLKLAEPLIISLAISRVAPPTFDVWRVVRWVAVASVVTAPFFTANLLNRWSALVGEPNQHGLLSAILLVLALSLPPSRSRMLQIVIAAIGMLTSASITSTVAATAGVAATGLWTPRSERARRALSPAALITVIPVAFIVVSVLRPDILLTLSIHSGQAYAIIPVLSVINPIFGGGWTFSAAYVTTLGLKLGSIHNVYLQLVADLGMIGIGFFVGLLVAAFRVCTDTRTRAVLVMLAIWLNSAGAFPGSPWGVLAAVLLAARLEHVEQLRRAPTPLAA